MQMFYTLGIKLAEPFIPRIINNRIDRQKEDPERVREKFGYPSKDRPEAKKIIWIHAASVGEAQAALTLLKAIQKRLKSRKHHFLITTGTKNSAELMSLRLPENATHQYYPIDHPKYVARFLDHWRPDIALWMESEIWPNMVSALKNRYILAGLMNARLSKTSYRNWRLSFGWAKYLLNSFDTIIAQTERDQKYFKKLGASHVPVSGNIKYCADPLDIHTQDFKKLSAHIKNRPVWVYASTHKGEEELAASLHKKLKAKLPNLLTIIVPRHPERREDILDSLSKFDLNLQLRTRRAPPIKKTDIYIADTIGELGLFYKLSPLAVIGRSFSDDGGGGHNPIEALFFNTLTLCGPHMHNQRDILHFLLQQQAAIQLKSSEDLGNIIQDFYINPEKYAPFIKNGLKVTQDRQNIMQIVMQELEPLLLRAGLDYNG